MLAQHGSLKRITFDLIAFVDFVSDCLNVHSPISPRCALEMRFVQFGQFSSHSIWILRKNTNCSLDQFSSQFAEVNLEINGIGGNLAFVQEHWSAPK